MSASITYTKPTEKNNWMDDNYKEVLEFVGPQPPCSTCNDSGEYETSEGFLHGCMPCNSRLIRFVDHSGKTVFADWGDTIKREDDGLHLVKGSEEQ